VEAVEKTGMCVNPIFVLAPHKMNFAPISLQNAFDCVPDVKFFPFFIEYPKTPGVRANSVLDPSTLEETRSVRKKISGF